MRFLYKYVNCLLIFFGLPIVFFLVIIDGYAQDISPQKIKIFNQKSGLHDDYIFCMDEDPIGNIWLGTRTGCSKYDGYTFTQFSAKDGFTNKSVWAIHVDSNGDVWFGTEGDGLYTFDGTTWSNVTTTQNINGLDNFFDGFIMEDSQGTIWGGGDIIQLFSYTDDQLKKINGPVRILAENQKHELYGIDPNGTSLYYYKKRKKFKVLYRKFESTLDIAISKSGQIWIAGEMDYIAQSKDSGYSFIQHPFEKDRVGNFWDLFIDDQDKIWAAFTNYIVRFDGNSVSYYERENGLPIGHYKYIFQDSSGNIWFCCFGGLAMLDCKPPTIQFSAIIPNIIHGTEFEVTVIGNDGKYGTSPDKLHYEYCIKQVKDTSECKWQNAQCGVIQITDLQPAMIYNLTVRATDEANNTLNKYITFQVANSNSVMPTKGM